MHLLKTNITIGGQPGSKIHFFNANAHKLSLKHTGCPKKNAPMFEMAISPAKMAPEIKVR